MSLALVSNVALGFTFAWLLGWALWALRRLARRDQNTLLFGFLLLFVLYGAPAGLDFVLGVPHYTGLPGYYRASHDPLTVILTCLYSSAVPAFWYLFCRRRVNPPNGGLTPPRRLGFGARAVLHLVVVSPLLALPFAPNASLYKSYGVTVKHFMNQSELEHHLYLRLLCIFALLAAAGLFSQQRRLYSLQSICLLLASSAAIWIHGKRNIVAFATFLVGYQLWHRGWLRRKHFVPALLLTALLLVGYSQVYNRVVRDHRTTESSTSQLLEDTRLDFCRDHVLRLVIYSELRPQRRILHYRGQSLLFAITMYVPRRLWPEKPMPYGIYVLASVFETSSEDTAKWGWSHPTGILDEGIANLGWLGMLFGPIFVVAIGLLGNRAQGAQARGLTALTIVSVLHLPLQTLTALGAVWVWILVANARRKRKEPPRPRTTS